MKLKKIQILINGKKKFIDKNQSIIDLLEILSLNNEYIAIEINQEVIPKSHYHDTFIQEKDKIEILQFIGGG